jgi:hypothetical protein
MISPGAFRTLMEKARALGHMWDLLVKPVDPDEMLDKLASLATSRPLEGTK